MAIDIERTIGMFLTKECYQTLVVDMKYVDGKSMLASNIMHKIKSNQVPSKLLN